MSSSRLDPLLSAAPLGHILMQDDEVGPMYKPYFLDRR